MLFRFPRLALGFVAVLAMFGPAAVAHAAGATEDGKTTWMVRPSDGEREDGRSWIEAELDPGTSVQEHMLVRNLSREAVTFSLVAADGYFTDTGRFNMQTSNEQPMDAGAWIDVQPTVEVASGADAIVPFTLAVPSDATPGDHLAGVAATIRSGGSDQVGIESRVGFRVMVRVTGDIVPAAAASVVGTHQGSWNPFEPGSASVTYTVTNTGNANLAMAPDVRLSGLFGALTPSTPPTPIDALAPGETRSTTVEFPAAWPLFLYTAEMTATATPIGDGLVGGPIELSAQGSVWAVPWAQAAVLLILAALVLWLWTDRRKRDRRIAELQRQVDEGPRASDTKTDASVMARLAWPATAALAATLLFAAAPLSASAAETVDGDGVTITVVVSETGPTPAGPGGSDSGPPAGRDDGDLAFTGAAPVWGAFLAAVGLIGGGIVLRRRRRIGF